MFAAIVSASIVVRFGLIEALLRFYYKDGEDPDRGRRQHLRRRSSGSRRCGALIALPFADADLRSAARPARAPDLARIAIGGLWVLTMFEFLLTLFRLEERARAFFVTTILNVLVDDRADRRPRRRRRRGRPRPAARQLRQRRRLRPRPDRRPAPPPLAALRPRPAAAAAALRPADDAGRGSRSTCSTSSTGSSSSAPSASPRPASTRWRSSSPRRSTSSSAASSSPGRRSPTRSATTTRPAAPTPPSSPCFVAGCAFVVTGMWLFSRWIVRALAAPEFFDSYEAIGLIATAVTLYALYMVLVVILGRTGRTEFNFPATARRPRRQRRPQPGPGAAAGDRRRRPRPGRLLPRRAGADVRLHPAPLPGPLRVGSPGPGRARSPPSWSALGELLLPTEGAARPARPRRPLRSPTRSPSSPAASSPPASARWLARLRHPGELVASLPAPAPRARRPSTAASPRPTRPSSMDEDARP